MSRTEAADFLVIPSACWIDGTAAVQRLDQAQHALCVELPPTFIENHPHRDARTVGQGLNHLRQLFLKILAILFILTAEQRVARIGDGKSFEKERAAHDRLERLSSPAYHILPNKQAEPVTVMVPAQVFHFGMLANHVETKLLDQQEIVDHGLVGGRGVEAVRPVTLVENAVMVEGFAIQAQLPVLDTEAADSYITLYYILTKGYGERVEIGVFRKPGMHLVDLAMESLAAQALDLSFPVEVGNHDFQAVFVGFYGYMPAPLLEVACNNQTLDIVLAHLFQPNTLVYSALSAVENSTSRSSLFSSDDALTVTRILNLDDQLIFLFDRVADIK